MADGGVTGGYSCQSWINTVFLRGKRVEKMIPTTLARHPPPASQQNQKQNLEKQENYSTLASILYPGALRAMTTTILYRYM